MVPVMHLQIDKKYVEALSKTNNDSVKTTLSTRRKRKNFRHPMQDIWAKL